MPCSWAYSSAAAICRAIGRASSRISGPCLIRPASIGPSTSSRASARFPLDSSKLQSTRNVGIIQGSQDLGFALKAHHTLFVSGKRFGQHFQRYVTAKSLIPRAIHFAHPAGAEQRDNVLGTQLDTRSKKHGSSGLWSRPRGYRERYAQPTAIWHFSADTLEFKGAAPGSAFAAALAHASGGYAVA